MPLSEAVLRDLARAADAIRPARSAAVICHASPDGDAIGGLLGVGRALAALGKKTHLIAPDAIPGWLAFLPGTDSIVVGPLEFPEVDLILTVESPTLARTDPVYAQHWQAFQNRVIVNVDHHISNEYYGTVNAVAPDVSSVCELLLPLVRLIGAPIDDRTATCLLTGIVSDTRSFRTSSVTAATLEAASELVAAGADLFGVSDRVGRTRSIGAVRLWSRVVGQLEVRGTIICAAVTRNVVAELGLTMMEADGLVEFLSDTRDIDAAVVLKEYPGNAVRVSIRSTGRLNVAAICQKYAGGGHVRAAGCTIMGPIAEVSELMFADLLEAVRQADALVGSS